jgi:hypothetical protein
MKQVSVTAIEKFRKSRELKDKAKAVSIEETSLTPAEERTINSYEAAKEKQSKGKVATALKGVDAAAAIWQRFRH